MTTLNTIIEEEKKRYNEVFGISADEFQTAYESHIKDFLTTAMQRAYEAGQKDITTSKE